MSRVPRLKRRFAPMRWRPLRRRMLPILTIVITVAIFGYGGWVLIQGPEIVKAVGQEQGPPAPERTTIQSGKPTLPAEPPVAEPEQPQPSPEIPVPSQIPVPSLEDDWDAEAENLPEPAKQAVLGFIDTAASMQPAPVTTEDEDTVSAPDYSGIAAGSALGELIAQFDEIQDNNWTQKGAARLAAVQGTDELTLDGKATRRVAICIDSSAVELMDQDGQVVLAAVAPGTRTALNYYDLQELDGSWRVVSHSFPDDPTC